MSASTITEIFPPPLELELAPIYPAATLPSGSTWSEHRDSNESAIPVTDQQANEESVAVRHVESKSISGKKTAIVIGCVTFSTAITTFLAGVVTIAIPAITVDLQLPSNLVLWPITIYSLTCGCTLLICGSIADVVGSRQTFLTGCLLQSISTLACGLSRTGTQMIVFRAFSGIAASFCLPSAVSLINEVFPTGRARNVAFASMGGAQPAGFGLGLVLGGVFTGTVGWHWGFWIAAIGNIVMLGLAGWQLPRERRSANAVAERSVWQRLSSDIDWVGAIIASISLAMLSYVIAAITGNPSNIRSSLNITLLALAFVFLVAFILWVGRQERLGRPALIPNSLWRHKVFSCICINVFCIWAVFNAFEQYLNFFFQDVQNISPLSTAVRFLPAPLSGLFTNIIIGLIVHRVRGDWIVIITTVPCAIGSLLMAIAQPSWSYWACAFIANTLNPVGADGIFTVSNLLITSMFPPKTQGVAGGVFNTVSQTGKSVGLALTALVANEVTARSLYMDKTSPDALLEGYRAAFWFCVSLALASLCVSVWGLRKIGKVGRKMD